MFLRSTLSWLIGMMAVALGGPATAGGPNAHVVIVAPSIESHHVEQNRQIQVYGPDGRVIYDEHTEYLGYPFAHGYAPVYDDRYPGYGRYDPPTLAAPRAPGGYGAPRSPHAGGYYGDSHPRGAWHRSDHHRSHERRRGRLNQPRVDGHAGERALGTASDRVAIPSQREPIPSQRQSLSPGRSR